EGDVGGAKAMERVDPLSQILECYRFRRAVVLGAVSTTQVTTPRNDELSIHRGVREKNARDRLKVVLNLHTTGFLFSPRRSDDDGTYTGCPDRVDGRVSDGSATPTSQ